MDCTARLVIVARVYLICISLSFLANTAKKQKAWLRDNVLRYIFFCIKFQSVQKKKSKAMAKKLSNSSQHRHEKAKAPVSGNMTLEVIKERLERAGSGSSLGSSQAGSSGIISTEQSLDVVPSNSNRRIVISNNKVAPSNSSETEVAGAHPASQQIATEEGGGGGGEGDARGGESVTRVASSSRKMKVEWSGKVVSNAEGSKKLFDLISARTGSDKNVKNHDEELIKNFPELFVVAEDAGDAHEDAENNSVSEDAGTVRGPENV